MRRFTPPIKMIIASVSAGSADTEAAPPSATAQSGPLTPRGRIPLALEPPTSLVTGKFLAKGERERRAGGGPWNARDRRPGPRRARR